MNVCDLKRGQRAVVLRVDLPEELHARLASLFVYPGAKLVLLKVSAFRKTYLVQAGSSKLALRREVAEGVRVWRL